MKAKKSLGQHFLTSLKVVGDIVRAGNIKKGDLVLEIGPGKGVLTRKLLFLAKKVIAIDKDRELVFFLQEKFKGEIESKRLKLIHQDILNYSPPSYSYKLVANIPYYITGEIFRKFLSSNHQPKSMILLVQKEVARRIMAHDGKESILSISIKAYGQPKYLGVVKAKNFKPEPKVDSAILLIDKISKDFFQKMGEQKFFSILKIGFAHKRKMLIGNLGKIASRKKLEEIFEKCNLPKKIRAEDLSPENWKSLFLNIFTRGKSQT